MAKAHLCTHWTTLWSAISCTIQENCMQTLVPDGFDGFRFWDTQQAHRTCAIVTISGWLTADLDYLLKVRLSLNEFMKSLILKNSKWKIWRISVLASKRRSNLKKVFISWLLFIFLNMKVLLFFWSTSP